MNQAVLIRVRLNLIAQVTSLSTYHTCTYVPYQISVTSYIPLIALTQCHTSLMCTTEWHARNRVIIIISATMFMIYMFEVSMAAKIMQTVQGDSVLVAGQQIKVRT